MVNADHLRDASPWTPMRDLVDLKHLGKFLEELGECVAERERFVTGPGLAEDCVSFENEIADVQANSFLVELRFGLIVTTKRRDPNDLPKDLGNCISAVSRCLIQGIDEREPVTNKLNRDWLVETMCDLSSSCDATITLFNLDRLRIRARSSKKMQHLCQWHSMAGPDHSALAKEIREHLGHQWSDKTFVQSEKVRDIMRRAADALAAIS